MQSPLDATRGSILQSTNSSPVARSWITRNIWIAVFIDHFCHGPRGFIFRVARWREKGRSLTASACGISYLALFVSPPIFFSCYQDRDRPPVALRQQLCSRDCERDAGRARALIGSRAICRESSSRSRENARRCRAASTTMEKKRNRPGQRTTVASASGSFRLLSRSSRGCSRNTSLGGRARCIRSKPGDIRVSILKYRTHRTLIIGIQISPPSVSRCSLTYRHFRLNATLQLITRNIDY